MLTSLMLLSLITFSQTNLTQTIRGKVIDIQTEETLPGATVIISDLGTDFATTSDYSGEFRIDNVPVGRHDIQITFVGYNPVVMRNLMLTTGKELVLEIKMEEQVIEIGSVTVKGYSRKDKPLNDLATVSARSFSIEETERYAGSLGDPSRMASNFAGVMSVADQRNDIIIRGNSPSGLLWRMEGIDIPNPNHFGSNGSTGGPVSMLNNNLLSNSDFYTGAFPAEFGNAMSGAFDLNMRPGNNQKYEFLGQIGFNGFELGAEGPFSKNSKASFIINARYSTLEIMSLLGMDFGTGAAIPQYKDVTFKVNIPTENLGKFSIFGIGGISYIEMLDSEGDDADFGFGGTDLRYGSDMGVVGLSHTYYFENSSKFITKVSSSLFHTNTKMDSLQKDGILVDPWRFYGMNFIENKSSVTFEYNKKFSAKDFIQIGTIFDYFTFDYLDSAFIDNNYIHAFDITGNQKLSRTYLTWQHKFTDDLTLNSGVHYLYLLDNETYSIEPRFGLKYEFNDRMSLNAGFGMHSQTQTMAIYYLKNDNTDEYVYTDLDLNRSRHYVIGYDYLIGQNFRLKLETYYQEIYNIPTSKEEIPQFSMINSGDSFHMSATMDLENTGTGKNYGTEITLEKFFSDGYYFLATASLYESKYTGSDGIERNTQFAGNFVYNVLGGYEFNIGKNSSLAFDIKTVYAGGKRYIPIDIAESKLQNTTVYDWNHAYENRYDDYFRLNARITFKVNMKVGSQEWGLDLQNLTNHQNIFQQYYNVATKEIQTDYQQAFMPMMTWRILF